MKIGAIYYTDFRAKRAVTDVCLEQLRQAFHGEIVSVSLGRPLDLGINIVMDAERGYPTLVRQILTALAVSSADYVFFLENDVLYHPSHFEFVPDRDDLYYYNANNWRWKFPENYLITYDGLISLSGLCCNRMLAMRHYETRRRFIKANGFHKAASGEPRWARKMGYEPGTKLRRRGGITDEGHSRFESSLPNIDIRHGRTFSGTKMGLHNFKHRPSNWREATMDEIPGWDLRRLFNLAATTRAGSPEQALCDRVREHDYGPEG